MSSTYLWYYVRAIDGMLFDRVIKHAVKDASQPALPVA